jgi:anthocyanidin reductase
VVSKVLLEKEAFRFAQENGLRLVSLCPGLTVGASPVPKAYTSVPAALSLLSGDEAAFDMLKGIEASFGGVPVIALEDLCRAHVFVAETGTASGRYVCCGLNTTVVEMARFLAEEYPQYNVVNTNRYVGADIIALISSYLSRQENKPVVPPFF